MFAKMVNLARSADEVKKEIAEYSSPATATASAPKYPWGTCLSLEDDTIDKVGLGGDLPEVGDVVQIVAMARVTSASKNEREDASGASKECRRVELQITDMGVVGNDVDQAVEKSAARRKRFYSGSIEAGDED